jgi:hypothetical protein
MNYTRIDFLILEIAHLPEISDEDADRIMRAVLFKMDRSHSTEDYVPRLKHDAPEPEWMRA